MNTQNENENIIPKVPLTFGSTISIKIASQPDLFLISQGFFVNTITLHDFSLRSSTLKQHEFLLTTFKILPFSTTSHFKTQNLIKNIMIDNQEDFTEKNREERMETILDLKQSLEEEYHSNISIYNKLKGTHLIYNTSVFQLMHVVSNKFLKLNTENEQNLYFELADYPDKDSFFKFQPCLKLHHQRNNIVYNRDIMVLQSADSMFTRPINLAVSVSNEIKKERSGMSYNEPNYKLLGHLELSTIIETDIYECQQIDEENEGFLKLGDIFLLLLSEKPFLLAGILENDPFEEFLNAFLSNTPETLSPHKNKFTSSFNTHNYNRFYSFENEDDISHTPQTLTKEFSLKIKKNFTVESENLLDEDQSLEELIDGIILNINQDIRIEFQKVKTNHSVDHMMRSLWRLEFAENYTEGGYARWDQTFRIKHFATGKYLLIRKEASRFLFFLSADQNDDNGVFKFVRFQSPNDENYRNIFISKKAVFSLKHVETGFNVGIKEGIWEHNQNHYEKEPILTPKDSYFNSYKLHKIENEDVWEFQFLVSALPTLASRFRFMKNLKKKVDDTILNKFDDFFFNSIETFQTLENFLTNKHVSYISYNQEYANISFKRQNLLREQCILGLLCLFLYKIYPTRIQSEDSIDDEKGEKKFFDKKLKDFNLSMLDRKKKIEVEKLYLKKRHILGNRIYRLLMLASYKNPLNQEYLFKFLNIFEKHIGLNALITHALEIIIGENDKILYELHKKKLEDTKTTEEIFLFNQDLDSEKEKLFLNELIKKMQDSKIENMKYRNLLMNLLIKFCHLGDRSIYINQEKIFKAMLEGKSFNSYNLFKLCLSRNELLIEIREKDGLMQDSLENFIKNPQTDEAYINFFEKQLHLYSKLCLSRNYNCCKFFAELFPLTLLVKYVLMEQVNCRIRALICSLISNIYVDKEPRVMIIRPNLIRVIHIKNEEPTPMANFKIKLKKLLSKKKKKENAIPLIERHKPEWQRLINSPKTNILLQKDNMVDPEEFDTLEGLKMELIKYMEGLVHDQTIDCKQTFNELTFEIIKLLHMMLKFGFFTVQKQFKHQSPLEKITNIKNQLINRNPSSQNNEAEKLFLILVQIICFDGVYETGIQEIKRQKSANPPLDKMGKTVQFMKQGFNEINKQVRTFFVLERQTTANKPRLPKKFFQASEEKNNPLYMKIQTMRKILKRFDHKCYYFDQKKALDTIQDTEKSIKLEICQIFEYLISTMDDFYLDNVLGYFHEVFITKFKDKTPNEVQKTMLNENHFLWILPNSMAEINSQISANHKNMRNFGGIQPFIRSFDEILGSPFIEKMLNAFYFAQDPNLQNAIMMIIMRISTKKFTFYGLIKKVELLFSAEQIEIYHVLNKLVNKMYLYSIDSQNWLQYNDDPLALDRIETLTEKTKKQLGKIESILLKNLKEKELLEMKQKILNNTGVLQLIINLMGTLLPYFENEKKEKEKTVETYQFQIGRSQPMKENFMDNVEKCKEILTLSYSILSLYCKDNEESQRFMFQHMHKLFMIDYKENIAQIEAFQSVLQGNIEISKQITRSDLSFFVELITKSGRKPEYLKIFETLNENAQAINADSLEIKQKVLEVLLDETKYETINPFVQREITEDKSFSIDEEHLQEYKVKFITVISEAFEAEIGVNLISRGQKWFPLRDLLYLLQDLSEDRMNGSYMTSNRLVKLLLLFLLKSENLMNDFFDDYKMFPSILDHERETLKFTEESLSFLKEGFIPLVSVYAQGVLDKTNFLKSRMHRLHVKGQTDRKIQDFCLKLFENKEKLGLENLKPKSLLLVSIANLAKQCNMSFDVGMANFQVSPNEETEGPTIQNTFKDTNDNESLDEASENKKFDQKFSRHQKYALLNFFLDPQKNPQSFKYDRELSQKNLNSAQVFEYWKVFREVFLHSEAVLKDIKSEKMRLTRSIFNIGESKSKNEEFDDIFIVKEDLLIKILSYIELWREKNVPKSMIVYLLTVLCVMLKQDKDGSVKSMFNDLNATKIIIVLIWEDEANDEYLYYLIKTLILLLQNGQVKIQRTIYNFFMSSASSQKFFLKIKQLIDKKFKERQNEDDLLGKKLSLKIFKLLQSFCYGHFLDLQNYLQNQTNSQNNYDLFSLNIEILISLEILQRNYDQIMQCFDSLIEAIQGPCRMNQETLINSKFLDYACQVLSLDSKNCKISGEALAQIKYKCVLTLHCGVECVEKYDAVLVNLRRAIPIPLLRKNLTQVYSVFSKSYNEEYPQTSFFSPKDPEIIMDQGFLIYELTVRLIKDTKQEDEDDMEEFTKDSDDPFTALASIEKNIIWEFSKFGKSFWQFSLNYFHMMKNTLFYKSEKGIEIIKQIEMTHLMQRALTFFSQNIAHIEIIRDNKLIKIYFPVLPICRMLPPELKNEFLKKVTWTNTQTKITDLMIWSEKFIKAMHHEDKLRKNYKSHKILEIVMNHYKLWEDCAFYLNLGINIVILLSYRNPPVSLAATMTELEKDAYKLHDPYFLDDQSFKNTTGMLKIMGALNLLFASLVVLVILIKRGPLLIDNFWLKNSVYFRNISMHRGLICILGLLHDFELSFYFFYLLMLILGLIIHPFFMVANMLDITRIEIMSLVFKVLWRSQKKFILFFIGFVLIEYYFSIIAYFYFSDFYQGNCNNLWVCLLTTFDETFKQYGSIGAYMNQVEPKKIGVSHESQNLYFSKFFFDNLQFILLPLLMVKVVTGTLIDTFGEIKSKLKEKSDDEKKICFICGIKRETLDKSSSRKQGFFTHIKHDHYLWNYVFYRTYLELKDKNKFNGNESYVFEKIKKNDISWFPVNQTSLVKDPLTEARDKQILIEQIEKNIMVLEKETKDTSSRILKLMKEFVNQSNHV